MKLAALALDYDGTTAARDVLDPEVREAVAEARRQHVAVLLVTGRQFDDLHRVAGDLTCFDVVVSENGAVLDFPASGRHLVTSRPPASSFLEELRRRGVPFTQGEVLVEAEGRFAGEILDALRTLEQPLILAFNRSRLMVLPQAIGKSTGLRQALFALRLSVHNTVGIGDAENDHDLLDACEVGVAVAWGSQALRAVADEVIPGSGPPAVAGFIRRLLAQPRLSATQMGRRRIMIGHAHNGDPVSLAVRGRTILIAGEPGTGKSWLAGLLCEQLILQGYCMCILDPEGDYRSLEALPGVVTLGGEDPLPQTRDLVRALRHPDVSVIIDLSKVSHHRKTEYLNALLPTLIALRRRTGLPHKILLDEAHYYLHDANCDRLIDRELAGYILVTYRISALASSIRATSDAVVMVTKESDPEEAKTLLSLCRPQPCVSVSPKAFGGLAMREAAILPGADEARGHIRRFQLAPRLTAHVRHRAKYLDMPVLDEHAFVFTENGRAGPRARTLKEFLGLLTALPERPLREHLRRHDFSRWFNDVLRDNPLGGRLRALEDRIDGQDAGPIIADIGQAIRARYETIEFEDSLSQAT